MMETLLLLIAIYLAVGVFIAEDIIQDYPDLEVEMRKSYAMYVLTWLPDLIEYLITKDDE